MGHLFGPVPSRRLGLSLGVDIVPLKKCTLSCVYCQIGKTPDSTVERREYISAQDILKELREKIDNGLVADWITFSGSGEPTLNSGIGEIIRRIKELTDIPVCVITNSTLLSDPQVRRDITDAEAVMPSLDSAIEATFRAICRPHPNITVEKVIEGLVRFRNEYKGKIWLEIMLIEGVNDSPAELKALREAAEKIVPDAIQLNTVVRPPAELSAKPLTRERLEEIRDFFGKKAEIIASFKEGTTAKSSTGIDGVRDYLMRRPGRTEDISFALGMTVDEVKVHLENLQNSGNVKLIEYFGKQFWEYIL